MKGDLMLNMRGKRRSKRRGAALVLVLIFGVGALMLVSTMLALSQTGAQQGFEVHRQKELHAVLKAGIAAAVNEINQERRLGGDYTDPEGNGPGATGSTSKTVRDGVAVTAPNGRVLGRYRSVVERASTRYGAAKDILVVTAAWPDFTNPRRMLAAEVDLVRAPLPFGTRPFEAIGDYDKTTKAFAIENDANVSITAPDADVPAVNITDPDFYADFVADIVPNLALVEGADPSNPGTLIQGAGTVTNDEPGVLNQETLEQIRDGINDRVDDANSTGQELTAAYLAALPGYPTVTLPDGVYTVEKELVLPAGVSITGSGTLVVNDEFETQKDASVTWSGDVIVADDSKALLKVAKDGSWTQTGGTLAVVSGDTAKFEFQKDSEVLLGTTAEPVALVVIAGSSGEDAKLTFKKDLDFTLVGVITVLASKKIEVTFDKDSGADGIPGTADDEDSNVDITGSMSLIMLDTKTAKTELKITVKKGQDVEINFSSDAVNKALDNLGEFFDPDDNILPLKVTTYWERATSSALTTTQNTVLDQQVDVMDAQTFANFGYPE